MNEEQPITIRAIGIERSFGTTRALRGVSLEIRRGELFGLVGPDAAGKTTMLRILAGLLRPNAGAVEMLGSDPFRDPRRDSIGLMPQEHSLYGDLSIEENMRFFSQLYCLSRSQYRERRERLLQITRLGEFSDRRADALSGGMYKKLALMCALLHQPEVLLLDEPTNGVDPVSRRELWELIYELVDQGMTVLVSTPYMDEASRCHRVALIDEGRIVAEDAPTRLVRDLECPIAEIVGGDRERIHALLASRPEVLAASPAGARLRVVLQPGQLDTLRAALSPLDARLVATEPVFEDVFLARIELANRALMALEAS